MSVSQRKLIRAAFASRLAGEVTFTPGNYSVDGAPLPGNAAAVKVYNARAVPLSFDSLPGICIYALNESAEMYDEAPRRYKRTLEVVVDVVVQATDVFADICDDLAQQIEQLVYEDETLYKTLADCRLSGVEIALRQEGQQPIIAQSIKFDAIYYTDAPDAADVNANLGELNTITQTWNLGDAVDAGDQVSDQFTLPQFTLVAAPKQGGNTGNGTCGAVTSAQGTQQGVYTLSCLTAAGTWSVTAPDGSALPAATTGVPYASDQINFTITAGAVAFAIGDGFTITVS